MCFINDKDSLKVGCIGRENNFILSFFKSLDIDNGDFRLSGCPFLRLVCSELIHQFRTRICGFHNQSTSLKFFFRLFHQIKAVNYKIELCYSVDAWEIIGKHIGKVEWQCCLAASLCVPDDTRSSTFWDALADNHRREELLVAHDMFLINLLDRSIFPFFCLMVICYPILNQEKKSLRTTHWCNDAIRRRCFPQICLVLRARVYNLVIEISKNLFFYLRINIRVWVVLVVRCNAAIQWIFFSKTVKRRIALRARAIEYPLNGDDAAHCIVFHVVWEEH